MGDFQEVDQMSMMKPITKWSARIPYTDRIPWFVRRAFSLAINGQPGPVFLELPYDVSGKSRWELYDIGTPSYIPSKRILSGGNPEDIDEAVRLLLKAKRPIVISGNGTVQSGAAEELKRFIELLGIPFLTTPAGRGILPETHPLALGVCGYYRTKVGKEVYSDSDLVLTIGTRNESYSTHQWRDFPEGAKFIQVDINPLELGKNWIPDVGIAGDARLVLHQLIEAIQSKNLVARDFRAIPRVQEIVKAKDSFEKEVEAECMIDATQPTAKRAVHELSRVFGRNTILVSENGSQDTWSYCYPFFTVQEGSACVPVAEQTCMGMGVVGAIAAKLTRPEKNVVCVTGDGAFQMYMKELPTAAQYKAGCTWLVLNNAEFGWVKHYQMKYAGWNTVTFGTQPDFVKWAEACQCYGRRVEKASEIRPALEEALKTNRQGKPAVIDVKVGRDMSHFERAE
jgi:acetolactate synthase-1/2/3 large subunit